MLKEFPCLQTELLNYNGQSIKLGAVNDSRSLRDHRRSSCPLLSRESVGLPASVRAPDNIRALQTSQSGPKALVTLVCVCVCS